MKLNYLKTIVCVAATATLVGCVSPGTTYNRSTGNMIDDRATTSRVKSALSKDSLVEGADIDVSTFRGDVHLSGFVDHPIQKERAGQIVGTVDGVAWFKNDIIVKTELPSENSMTEGQAMKEPAGAARNQKSQPSSSNWQKGSGTLETAPGVDRAVGSTQNSDTSRSAGTDNLSQRVNRELITGDSASTQNIRAENNNGKITLHGTVKSEAEKRAIENRVKAVNGVNEVNNELEVQK